jgi:hypothetical protein
LQEDLRKSSGDPSVAVVELRIGSAYLEIESTAEALEVLRQKVGTSDSLFAALQVTEVLATSAFYERMAAGRSATLQSCYSPLLRYPPSGMVYVAASYPWTYGTKLPHRLLIDVFVSSDAQQWHLAKQVASDLRLMQPFGIHALDYTGGFMRDEIYDVYVRLEVRLVGESQLFPTVSFVAPDAVLENRECIALAEVDALRNTIIAVPGVTGKQQGVILLGTLDQPEVEVPEDAVQLPSPAYLSSAETRSDTAKPPAEGAAESRPDAVWPLPENENDGEQPLGRSN